MADDARTHVSDKTWVPFGFAIALAGVTGGGGFATAMWIMNTLNGVKADVAAAAGKSASDNVLVREDLDTLTTRVDELLETSEHSLGREEFENWVLRLEIANRKGIIVPPVDRK